MLSEEKLQTLEGLHTLETISAELGLQKTSALNLVSKLKKEGHVTVWAHGKKRIYRITARKQRKRDLGMYDIINKYSPIKIQPSYDHQVHGQYGTEEAIVDALETKSFRIILASMRLFNQVKNWPKLYALAKEKDCWQKICALHEVASMNFKVRRMPTKYLHFKPKDWVMITDLRKNNFPEISEKWKVHIPFNQNDLEEIK